MRSRGRYSGEMLQPLARRLRDRVDAKLIDTRFLRREYFRQNEVQTTPYTVDEYMVELAGVDGTPVRLLIEEKSYNLNVPPPAVGDTVALLVNKKRTQAVFDRKDPRNDFMGAERAREAARKAKDEARFEAKLGELDDGSAASVTREAEDEALAELARSGEGTAALEAMEAAEEARRRAGFEDPESS